MKYLGYSEAQLKQLGSYWTAKEIDQQPVVWSKTLSLLAEQRESIDAFLAPILQQENLRIILTGAGTSSFIGEILTPFLIGHLGMRVEAIATTDLVSNPKEFLQPTTPTLLVSFARSGSSPESIAAVEYADTLLDNCYQLAITCNPNGDLYNRCQGPNKLAILMPEETNDQSLAMTSSFTAMLLSALYLFTRVESFEEKFKTVIDTTRQLIAARTSQLKNIATYNYNQVIYLGSGVLSGLAQESALKLLELTDGKVVPGYNSPLGFRHGPKAALNQDTLVVVFVSNQSHTKKFDIDLINELKNEKRIGAVIAISASELQLDGKEGAFNIEGLDDLEDIFLLFPYVVWAQIYAVQCALKLGISPDNPSSSGMINRVVQGVTIYAL